MALFADFGSWLRSARRDNFTDSPISAIEKLKSGPRPIQDADKEDLVGAVLTMSSSLHMALSILGELLPQEHEQSRERLGEVLCPTLGHLLDSVQSTLRAFERPSSPPATRADAAPQGDSPQPAISQPPESSAQPLAPQLTPSSNADLQQCDETRIELSSSLEKGGDARRVEVGVESRPQTQLVQALQAEMRVQAAIHVAVESLEFAEAQLKLVKEVNQLHGGRVDVLQKNFYVGYNRLLLRAFELQRRELGLSAGESLMSADPGPLIQNRHPDQHHEDRQSSPKQNPSVWFHNLSSAVQSPAQTPRTNGMDLLAASERRPLGRRNTIQGIRQEETRGSAARPPFKRRLSLADELAMVGEDSESGNQEETSEGETSASELEESDLESRNGSRRLTSTATEGSSTDGDESGEDSEDDSSDEEGSGDETLNAMDCSVNGVRALSPAVNRSQSRLPRPQQPGSRDMLEMVPGSIIREARSVR